MKDVRDSFPAKRSIHCKNEFLERPSTQMVFNKTSQLSSQISKNFRREKQWLTITDEGMMRCKTGTLTARNVLIYAMA